MTRRFGNTDGSWLALFAVGAVSAVGAYTAAVARRRGSRGVEDLTDEQLALLYELGRAPIHMQAGLQARLQASGIDPYEYGETQVRGEQVARKRRVLNDLFGPHVGENADWIDLAWHIGPGHHPNSVSGDYYIIEDEYGDDDWRILRRWHLGVEPQDEQAAKAAAQAAGQQYDPGNDYIQEIAVFDNFEALMAYLRDHLEEWRPRRWLGTSAPGR